MICEFQKIVISRLCISLALQASDGAVTLLNDLVKLVLVVDAIVWRRASVHFQVTFSSNGDTGNRRIHSRRSHSRRLRSSNR